MDDDPYQSCDSQPMQLKEPQPVVGPPARPCLAVRWITQIQLVPLASFWNHVWPLHNDDIEDPITAPLQRLLDDRVLLWLGPVPVVIDIDHHRLEWIFFLEIQAQII